MDTLNALSQPSHCSGGFRFAVLAIVASCTRVRLAAFGKGTFPQPGILVLACWLLITAGVAYAVTQPIHNLHLF